jgi:hypothetical protein
MWRYGLLRHDRISDGDTLQGMLGGAVTLVSLLAAAE